MPKTLLFNWEKEIKTFAPELSVYWFMMAQNVVKLLVNLIISMLF